MTAICYRDGVMAGDTAWQADGLIIGYGPKVKKINGWLAGAAGNAEAVHQFFKWIEEGMEEEAPKVENLGGLLVNPEGQVFSVEDELFPYPMSGKYFVEGSGSKVMMGALEMGATAEEAVKAAIKWDTGCGGDIIVVKL